MAFDPAKFVREVRAEMAAVTWPSRKETHGDHRPGASRWSALAALFFFLVDQIIGIGVRALFGIGG